MAASVIGLAGTDAAAQTAATGIVAVVNNEVVSALDLESRTKLVIASSRLPRNQETVRRVSQQVLRNLIDERLRMQEAERLKIDVEKQELDRALAQIERQNRMRPGVLPEVLERDGIDLATLTTQLRAEIAWSKIIRREVNPGSITDEQIDEAIEQLEASKGKPEYLVAEIFLPFDVSKSRSETLATVRKLVTQIREGANFNTLAQTFSQSTSAPQGGNLGWVRPDQLDQRLANALADMKEGQVAGPIEAADGYYILYLRNQRVSEGIDSGDEVVDIQLVMKPVASDAAEPDVVAQMNSAREATQSAESCGDLVETGKNGGLTQASQLSDVKLENLTPELRQTVTDLPVGQASTPLRSGDRLIVLMVCDRKAGLSDAEVRERISDLLIRQRAELVARRLMRNLRRQAFIDIRR